MASSANMSVKIIITAIFSVLILCMFLGLGKWQLDRLHWKQSLLQEIDQRIAAPAQPLPQEFNQTRDKYLPVEVEGEIETPELHVLVSTKNLGAGFRIIQPMILRDGRRIMLDRGFVNVAKKADHRSTGQHKIRGNLHWPNERDKFTPEDDAKSNYWYARDVGRMAAYLNTMPVLVVAQSASDPAITPLPITTEGIANNHFQYAMTWFLMALTWVVMTGYALWRMKNKQRKTILKEH